MAGAVLVIALTIFTGQQFFGSGPDALPAVTLDQPSDSDDTLATDEVDDTAEPGDGDDDEAETTRVEGEGFNVGEDVEASFEVGEEWAANVVVEEEGLVLFDAVYRTFADLTMEIWTEDGDLLAVNDDRGELSELGGARLDPLIAADLPAGSYTVVIGTYNDAEAGDFSLITGSPAQMAGPSEEMEVDDGRLIARTVQIPDAAEHTVTATSDLGESTMFVIDSDAGTAHRAVITPTGAEWTGHLPAGRHLLLIADDEQRAFDLTLEISTP